MGCSFLFVRVILASFFVVSFFRADARIKQRQEVFLKRLEKSGIESAILFGVTDIFYLTGFHFHPTERPIGLFFAPNGKSICLFRRWSMSTPRCAHR